MGRGAGHSPPFSPHLRGWFIVSVCLLGSPHPRCSSVWLLDSLPNSCDAQGRATVPSLTTYRQTVAPIAGPYAAYTSDDVAMTTTTQITTALISSLAIDDSLTDYWHFIPGATLAADKLRTVSTYAPGTGTLTVDRAWSAVAIPRNVAFELHGIVAPVAGPGINWQNLINEALKRCMVVVEFTVTPTANANRHDLTTGQSWLTDPNWVRQVGWLTTSEARAEVDPYDGRQVNGFPEKLSSDVYLVHKSRTFVSTEVIYVKAIKPAYDHCRASGSGAYGDQSGITAEAHQAEPNDLWVAYGALVALCERFRGMDQATIPEKLRPLIARQTEWAAAFSDLTRKNFQLPPRTLRNVRRWGPVMRGYP